MEHGYNRCLKWPPLIPRNFSKRTRADLDTLQIISDSVVHGKIINNGLGLINSLSLEDKIHGMTQKKMSSGMR